MITQQHNRRPNIMLLRDFQHTLVLKQRAAGTSQWTICRDMDAFAFAEIDNLLLWQQRVVFDLVRGRCDCCFSEQLLHVLNRVVCDANGFDFVRVGFDEGLHVQPGLDVAGGVVDVAGAVFEFGEEGVVAFTLLALRYNSVMLVHTLRVHGNRPMNQIKIHIRSLQQIQTLLQTFLGTGVECAP